MLITVSGVAWRLTSHDSAVSSCGTMLGLTTDPHAEPNRRFVPRIPPYGRYSHPYAGTALMYIYKRSQSNSSERSPLA